VFGGFSSDMRIDATLVANTSWLRAILWAFVLALREQTIEEHGANPFPLMVLDDPQVTYDPRNKRKWAQELVRLANLPATDRQGAQIFLLTHDKDFHRMITDVEGLKGQQGMIAGAHKGLVAKVANTHALETLWCEAEAGNDDAKGRLYITEVRVYIESLLRIMLRGEGLSAMAKEPMLNDLRDLIISRHAQKIRPFDCQVFDKLAKSLGAGRCKIKIMNDAHHRDDGTIGVADARDVRKAWKEGKGNIQSCLRAAFHLLAEFDAYRGPPNVFTWLENVVGLNG